MDDILKRLDPVESSVSDTKAQVSGLTATATHLARKADVSQVEHSLIKWIVGTLFAAVSMAFVVAKYLGP